MKERAAPSEIIPVQAIGCGRMHRHRAKRARTRRIGNGSTFRIVQLASSVSSALRSLHILFHVLLLRSAFSLLQAHNRQYSRRMRTRACCHYFIHFFSFISAHFFWLLLASSPFRFRGHTKNSFLFDEEKQQNGKGRRRRRAANVETSLFPPRSITIYHFDKTPREECRRTIYVK